MKNLLIIGALFFGIAISGCTNERESNTATGSTPSAYQPNSTPSVTPAGSQTPSASPAPADENASGGTDFEGTAAVTEKKNVNIKANGVMSAVRSARHGNYDRVVFEFTGAELPSYHIEYIGKPVSSCGSGNAVSLAGDARLEVRFTDAVAHAPEGDATIKDRTRTPNLPAIKEMKITCDFEGEVTWVLGVTSPNKYRVLELKNPTRLAVDIKHQ